MGEFPINVVYVFAAIGILTAWAVISGIILILGMDFIDWLSDSAHKLGKSDE